MAKKEIISNAEKPSFVHHFWQPSELFFLNNNIPLGYSCTKSGGLSSKNRFILYRGFPLWLGSTGEVVILYRSQGVKLELGGLRFILGLAWCIWCWGFLFYIDFHFMLDSRQGLGFNLCTMLKYTLKSSPCSYFSTVRLGGLDFTQMYTYIKYYRIIYNILIYIYILF